MHGEPFCYSMKVEHSRQKGSILKILKEYFQDFQHDSILRIGNWNS
jgi:hypothetical protein